METSRNVDCFLRLSHHFQNQPAGIHKSPDSLNPLSPNSDQHEISPYNINALENIVVMRIEYTIGEDKSVSLIDNSTNSLHYFY